MSFIDVVKERARSNKKTIVLPESMDARVIEAASIILKEGFADIVLLGDPEEVAKVAPQFDISGAEHVKCIEYKESRDGDQR